MADTNRPQNRTLNVITVCPVEVKCKLNSIKKDLSWLKKGGLATQSNSPGSASVVFNYLAFDKRTVVYIQDFPSGGRLGSSDLTRASVFRTVAGS